MKGVIYAKVLLMEDDLAMGAPVFALMPALILNPMLGKLLESLFCFFSAKWIIAPIFASIRCLPCWTSFAGASCEMQNTKEGVVFAAYFPHKINPK